MASGSAARIVSSESGGREGNGSDPGMPPNRLPIVSIGSLRTKATTAQSTTATKMPGQAGRHRRSPTIMAMLAKATATAAWLIVPSAAASACSLGMKSGGS